MSDCISRESALDVLDDYAEDIESGNWGTAYSKARASMCELPSVEPEGKTGKWIEHKWAEEENGLLISNWECSLCKMWERKASDFCPNCGAKMEVNE